MEFSSYISLMVLAAINICVFMPLTLVIDRARSDYSIVVQFRILGTMCPLGHSKRFLVTLAL